MNHQKGQGISVRLRQFADRLICSTRTIIFICLVWRKKERNTRSAYFPPLFSQKQAIVNRFYEFYSAFCRLHVFALSSDWLSFAAHCEIKAKTKKSEFAFLLIGHFRVRKPSLSKWGQVYNLSCENEFYSNDSENPFHIKGWALNLVLIQRFGGTRKWPN